MESARFPAQVPAYRAPQHDDIWLMRAVLRTDFTPGMGERLAADLQRCVGLQKGNALGLERRGRRERFADED